MCIAADQLERIQAVAYQRAARGLGLGEPQILDRGVALRRRQAEAGDGRDRLQADPVAVGDRLYLVR